MIAIQDKNGITVPSSKLELSAPGAIYDAGYHFVKSGEKLGKDSSISVDTLLESHNLMDPSFYDVVMDLVLDAGKKLHPSDVNTLRKELDARIISAGTNVDALSVELSKTIDTIDGFMQDIVRSANTAYQIVPRAILPKKNHLQ